MRTVAHPEAVIHCDCGTEAMSTGGDDHVPVRMRVDKRPEEA